jgi:hypothetical protein
LKKKIKEEKMRKGKESKRSAQCKEMASQKDCRI